MNVLITGATGFLGTHLIHRLIRDGRYIPTATVRSASCPNTKIRSIAVGDLLPNTDWTAALDKIDVVIHLAARVHIMQDTSDNPLDMFRTINTAGTLNLIQQADAAGVCRFIYLSSIKVNGENTTGRKPFTAVDNCHPIDPYAISKFEAEQGIIELSNQSDMEFVILRPPLVYGPGVKANFLSMMQWLDWGLPLPLGAINNQRSLVAVENLVDLIITCIEHPPAGNRIFLVSDDEDVSTTELLQQIGDALGKPARLLPIPQTYLVKGLSLFGKRAVAQRLCESLQVDICETKDVLNWKPPVSMEEALARTAKAYLEE